MITESKNIQEKDAGSKEDFMIHVMNPMLYDRLHTLSVEYSVSVELLVNVALERLINDIDFIRELRTGKVNVGYLSSSSK